MSKSTEIKMTTTTTQKPAPGDPAVDVQQQSPEKTASKVCPNCGSDRIRESSTRRGMDMMPSNVGKIAHRCRNCRGRFYIKDEGVRPALGSPDGRRKKNERKREPLWKHPTVRRHMNEISIACGSLVAFAIFLYLLARSGVSF